MIGDFLAMAVVGMVTTAPDAIMIMIGVVAVNACRRRLQRCGMVGFVRRMRVRRRAEEETYSKQQPTKHPERSEAHSCSLAVE